MSARPDDTGRRLLVAAAEVFAEKGYDRAGVAEIARRAGPDVDAASDLADALTRALLDATRRLRRHEALQYLVAHEPGVILPYTSFDGIQPLLDLAAATVAPLLERHLPTSSAPQQAAELSEWLVRVVLAYALDVDDEAVVDLTDPADTRRFVTTFAVPGVEPDQPGPDRTQP
ncbi:MAG: helix-turn-helix domain-containing protein [Acidimicrobiales bacterium]